MMKIRHTLKNQRGMTLVEIVAVLVIIGFLSLLILNVLTDSTDQYNEQVQENTQINNISYVLKIVTKEIRMTNAANIEILDNGIRFKNSDTNYQLDTTTHSLYKFNGSPNTFENDDEILAHNIAIFNIEKVTTTTQEGNTEWRILIQDVYHKKVETTIFSRS